MNIIIILFCGLLFGLVFVGFIYLPLYYKYKSKWFKKKYPKFHVLKEERDNAILKVFELESKNKKIKNTIDEYFKALRYREKNDKRVIFKKIQICRRTLKNNEMDLTALKEISREKTEKFENYVKENNIKKVY